MIKVAIHCPDSVYTTKFLTCRGDELKECDHCKVRFYCYTGFLPKEFAIFVSEYSGGEGMGLDRAVEYNIFGRFTYMMDYDYNTHNKYYKQKWHMDSSGNFINE